MEKFEIHITGNESILFHAKKLGLKTIIVILVKPDRTYLRTEFMTSHIMDAETYVVCEKEVHNIVETLKLAGVQVKRVKIECPPYAHYVKQSLYLEVHEMATINENRFPLSQNHNKSYFLLTDREYDKVKYNRLMAIRSDKERITELCLYDSNVDEDWFDLYL